MDKKEFKTAIRFSEAMMAAEDIIDCFEIHQNDFDHLDFDDYGRYREAYLDEFCLDFHLKKVEFATEINEESKQLSILFYEPFIDRDRHIQKKKGGIQKTLILDLSDTDEMVKSKVIFFLEELQEELGDESFVHFNLWCDKEKVLYAKDIYNELLNHLTRDEIEKESKLKREVVHFDLKNDEDFFDKEKEEIIFFGFSGIFVISQKNKVEVFQNKKEAKKQFLTFVTTHTEKLFSKRIDKILP